MRLTRIGNKVVVPCAKLAVFDRCNGSYFGESS